MVLYEGIIRGMKRIIFQILVSIIVFFIGFNANAQDSSSVKNITVVLKDKTELQGTIVKEDSTSITIRTPLGAEKVIQRMDLTEVREELNKKFLFNRDMTGAFGFTAFTPALLNIRGGFRYKSFGFHTSLGKLGSWYGIQFNPMIVLHHDEEIFGYFSGVLGYMEFDDPIFNLFGTSQSRVKWSYMGMSYVLHHKGGFLFDLGLTLGGKGRPPSKEIQILFQIGYVFQF